MMRSPFILLSCLILSACAQPQKPAMEELPLPPERLQLTGYSLLPLDEKGWLLVKRDAYQIALVKAGDRSDETLALQATLFQLPPISTIAELTRFVKDSQAKDTDPARFKVLRHGVSAYDKKSTTCVQSNFVSEDHAARKRSGKTGAMILSVRSLTCIHPSHPSLGVNLTYSDRYYQGEADINLDSKAAQLFASLEFSRVK